MSELLKKVDALLVERENYGVFGDSRLSDWRWRAAAELSKVAEELRTALLQNDETKRSLNHYEEMLAKTQLHADDLRRDLEESNRLNGELLDVMDKAGKLIVVDEKPKAAADMLSETLCNNWTPEVKRKCVCGGVGLGVACEAGCPNHG